MIRINSSITVKLLIIIYLRHFQLEYIFLFGVILVSVMNLFKKILADIIEMLTLEIIFEMDTRMQTCI